MLKNTKNISKVEYKISECSGILTVEEKKNIFLDIFHIVQTMCFSTRIQNIITANNSTCSRSKLSKLF